MTWFASVLLVATCTEATARRCLWQAAFAFETLDVKDALVGAPYVYELDLMNRCAVPAICACCSAVLTSKLFSCRQELALLVLAPDRDMQSSVGYQTPA